MDGYVALIDMAIVGVPAVVFGVWQLVSINREIAKDKRKADLPASASPEGASPEGASPEGSGHPVGEHRLDDR